MLTLRKPHIGLLLALIPLVLLFAIPDNASSTPITQTEVFTNQLFGTQLAQVDVTVYEPGDIFGGTLDYDRDIDHEYLYYYTITNKDALSFPVYLEGFLLALNKQAPVSYFGADSPSVRFLYDLADNDIFFLDLDIPDDPVGQSLAVYLVSTAAPELVDATIKSNLGSSDIRQLWAPDPDHILPVPEPITLLLVGTGLIGLAALRRRTREQ